MCMDFAVPPVRPQDDVLTSAPTRRSGLGAAVNAPLPITSMSPADMTEGLYWYHPHVHGEVQAQMLMGLSGAIVVEGPQDDVRRAAGIDERVLIVRQTQDLDAGKTQAAAMTGRASSIRCAQGVRAHDSRQRRSIPRTNCCAGRTPGSMPSA